MALVLLGKSCSGKDTIREELKQIGIPPAISYTTRPMREGEKQDETYHFVSQEEFQRLGLCCIRSFQVASGEVWSYGFDSMDLNDWATVIIDPQGYRDLEKETNCHAVGFYIKVHPDILYSRAVNRGGDSEEIERRLKADARDFQNLQDVVHYVINNDQGDIKKTARCIYDLYINYIDG